MTFNATQYLRLVEQVQERSSCATSTLHGESHWRSVAWTALHLAEHVRSANPRLALLFALFHDSMRWTEDEDPGHAERGAKLAEELGEAVPGMNPSLLRSLVSACSQHTGTPTSSDVSIGLCWDADRLNLWRVGIRPNFKYLSTMAAREPQWITWAKNLHEKAPSWQEIAARVQVLPLSPRLL